MVMYQDKNAGRNQSVKTDNISFAMVEEFKFLGKPKQIKFYLGR